MKLIDVQVIGGTQLLDLSVVWEDDVERVDVDADGHETRTDVEGGWVARLDLGVGPAWVSIGTTGVRWRPVFDVFGLETGRPPEVHHRVVLGLGLFWIALSWRGDCWVSGRCVLDADDVEDEEA